MPDNDGHPYPAYGFMHNDFLNWGWEEEAQRNRDFAIEMGEVMLNPAKLTIDTTCPYANGLACCDTYFQKNGGCHATQAQPPSCPFFYNYHSPSVNDVSTNPKLENKYGPQFQRVVCYKLCLYEIY